MNFKMTPSCCTIVDKRSCTISSVSKSDPDDCTCSLTEQKVAINDYNDAMMLTIGHYWYKTKHNSLK